MSMRFVQRNSLVPILAPVDLGAGATVQTAYVDLNLSHWVTFYVQLGVFTSDSTDTVTITVQCSSAGSSNSDEAEIGFSYRTAVLGTDLWGTITTCSTAGLALNAATHDNYAVAIDIDPADVNALADADSHEYRFLRLVLTTVAGVDSCLAAASAFLEPRYPQHLIPSSS